jgi:23S rRNA pseudouridine1911/1915/1917 synthase
MEKTLSLYVMGDKPSRLDTYIANKAHLSRTQVQKLIEDGCVILNNNEKPKTGARLKEGDIVRVRIPIVKESSLEKQDLPIEVLYEDDHVVVVNKERGMVVHPAAGTPDGTLVNALLHHVDDLEGIGDEKRPGIVHRLDKNTSGVMIVAKTQEAHQRMVDMFQNRKIQKEYIAVVTGKMKGREGVINLPIGRDPKDRKKMAVVPDGKKALTRWKQKKAFKNYTVVSAFPETGRTHQIRVHFKYLNHPVLGDPEYAPDIKPPADIKGQALHAYKLQLEHPITGETLVFTAPIPQDMEDLINEIETLENPHK